MSVNFTEKNRNRATSKQRNAAEFRQGRTNRRAFAWHGAFGNEVARVFNDCVMGTTGRPRQVKKGAEDYDSGTDYDG